MNVSLRSVKTHLWWHQNYLCSKKNFFAELYGVSFCICCRYVAMVYHNKSILIHTVMWFCSVYLLKSCRVVSAVFISDCFVHFVYWKMFFRHNELPVLYLKTEVWCIKFIPFISFLFVCSLKVLAWRHNLRWRQFGWIKRWTLFLEVCLLYTYRKKGCYNRGPWFLLPYIHRGVG